MKYNINIVNYVNVEYVKVMIIYIHMQVYINLYKYIHKHTYITTAKIKIRIKISRSQKTHLWFFLVSQPPPTRITNLFHHRSFWMLYKWIHIKNTLSCLTSFIQHYIWDSLMLFSVSGLCFFALLCSVPLHECIKFVDRVYLWWTL